MFPGRTLVACLVLVLAGSLASGCRTSGEDADSANSPTAMENDDKDTTKSRPAPTRVPPVTGGVPPGISPSVPGGLLTAMQADLAQRQALAASDITVLQAQPVTWRDGSMGCPEDGMAYTQALVPGYRVVLRAGGVDYAYHASRRGQFTLCKHPASEGIAPPGAGGEAVE